MHLEELLKEVDIVKSEGKVNGITGVTDDSRKVAPGYLFVALRGGKADGHKFIGEAVKNGAVALLVEEEISTNIPYFVVPNTRKTFSRIVSNYYGNPSEHMKIIGITGTNGKTTTSYLLSSIYSDSICFSTIKYFTQDKEIKATNTTPSPLILQKELYNALNKGIKIAILEVSSHGIVQNRISYIDFDYGVFTNISRDHLDYHKTFKEYMDAKSRFFESLGEEKMALINIDDLNAPYFIKNTNSRVVTYGLKKGNIQGTIIKNTIEGLILSIEGMGRKLELRSSLIGSHNAYNILAAASVAIGDNVSDSRIIEGIEKAPSPPGRMEKIDIPEPISVIVDYAHSPEALNSVISSLKDFGHQRVITVFGAGGDRDRGKRAIMGMVASKLSDIVILTSDNPRSEDPQAIIEDILNGVDGGNLYRIPDRKEAVFKALDIAKEGDIVLIAGKGHEEYQEIGGNRIPFSDRECVKEYFKK
ncbi:UDP-N-acetylmuramoyl-L-alanyl-D-glutamate--2,6-diaminopimelate ligase [candidate division WOR-3 bacterium]|nr:UDP-N-acetylmuramoyl-L-alanyl-D-glutamate--2,6-diaminopimelate ligase [candidate division WOR-3 bacterium]